MTKIQKIWLGVFAAMFILPELLFSPLLSLAYFLSRATPPLIIGYLANQQFIINNQIFLFAALIIEGLGVLGLLVYNFKFNRNAFRTFFAFSLSVLLACLIFVFYIGFLMRHGIGF